ncbi:uncharacterized protein [Nicotiana sylvestris]|uniref:uncharacterized protein n=1 Tax=Nicotiana sylvestris TaxID=4096 RepID=UPI00388C6C0C
MSPDSKNVPFESVNLEGRNIGASMIVRRGTSSSESRSECCSINIYISNNIQGVNNSILLGSKVKMGDPAVNLSFKDLGFEREKKKSKMKNGAAVTLCWMLLFAFVSVLFPFLFI